MKKFENFCKCLENLIKFTKNDEYKNEFYNTTLMALFNLCFEHAWKALQSVMFFHGVGEAKTGSPREIIKLAYRIGFIDNDELWLEILGARNKATHIYSDDEDNDKLAQLISLKYIPEFEVLKIALEKKIND